MKPIRYGWILPGLALWFLVLGTWAPPARAGEARGLSRGQSIYLPVYSYIYYGDKEKRFALAVTLSLRNTDPVAPITILSADYYDNQGTLAKKFVTKPLILGPLAAARFLVAESDPAGGAGASLLIKWRAETEVNPPLAQSVMIGTDSNQGISFVCEGHSIEDHQN